MIAKECNRLAEVDFSIAVVSKHSARDKSIRHGRKLAAVIDANLTECGLPVARGREGKIRSRHDKTN